MNIGRSKVPPLLKEQLRQEAIEKKFIRSNGIAYLDEDSLLKKGLRELFKQEKIRTNQGKIRIKYPSDSVIKAFFINDENHDKWIVDCFCQLILECTYDDWLAENFEYVETWLLANNEPQQEVSTNGSSSATGDHIAFLTLVRYN